MYSGSPSSVVCTTASGVGAGPRRTYLRVHPALGEPLLQRLSELVAGEPAEEADRNTEAAERDGGVERSAAREGPEHPVAGDEADQRLAGDGDHSATGTGSRLVDGALDDSRTMKSAGRTTTRRRSPTRPANRSRSN